MMLLWVIFLFLFKKRVFKSKLSVLKTRVLDVTTGILIILIIPLQRVIPLQLHPKTHGLVTCLNYWRRGQYQSHVLGRCI